MVGGGCRRAVVPTYPAVCRCRLVRVCPSGLTHGPFRVQKGLGSVWVSRDPVEILPQTILLSPRGVSGISHPGRNESFAKRSSVRRMETTAFLQVHGSHPVSNEFGRGTGSGAHVAAIPHANVREGVCASFHQRPPILNRRILSRTTSPRSGAVRSHIHLQSHTKGHPSRARPMMRSSFLYDKPDVGFGTRTATRA